MRSRSSSRSATGRIDKLDFDSNRKTAPSNDGSEHSGPHLLDDDESLLSDVVDGIIERDRRRMKQAVTRYLSFACAILNCLCAGSITAYSLYGHLFLSRLHYTQLQVNIVSIAAEVSMYLPVPLFGFLCDRYSPRPLSLFSGTTFGVGYLLAAFTYHQGPPAAAGGHGWPFGIVVLAFVFVGMGTSSMYLSAVTTCAKNFGRGKHKGVALAMPIAAFGLSGMWQSQVGSRLLYEKTPDGRRGDVDVFRFFIFLAAILLVAGLLGAVTLQVVDEEELIDEAVEELERSGLLEDSAFFQRSIIHDRTSYGTIDDPGRLSTEEQEHQRREADAKRDREDEDMRKKTWLLNVETRRFLADPTMWFLAGGFFLVTGPGEAFINNLGTIIGTLYPPPLAAPPSNSAATHVSIVATTSTLARLLTGALCDLLAPSPATPTHHPPTRRPSSASSSLHSLSKPAPFSLSRLTFLLTSTLLLSLGQLLLASGLVQARPALFPLVSALVGTGYGAVFALTPIIVSVVWGVENFGTNWGIVAMVPAAGATVWGVVYSAVYQWGARRRTRMVGGGEGAAPEVLCFGKACYEGTFWAMVACSWVACGLWAWAWRGKGGWLRRGVLV